MKIWKKEEIQVKLLFIIMICVLLTVLIPLFYISRYSFMSADDFSFSREAVMVWKETHSVLKVMAAQVSTAREYYFTWQGTFFSTWFLTSMVGIFGSNSYYVASFLSLGGVTLAEIILFLVFFIKIMNADIYRAGIITASCLSLQILLTPVPSEAYYWFSGAITYTFIYALGMLLTAIVILLYFSDKVWKTIILESLLLLLAIAVGGSNYVTGLTMLTIFFLCTFWVFFMKHPLKWMYLINTIVYIAVFLINVMAPGNQKRQIASGVEHMSAVEAIIRSLIEAAVYMAQNIYLPSVILGIMFIPLFLNIVKKSKYKYPLPFLVSIISFGVFAAQFTPTLYALGILGAGRVINLYRLNSFILLYGNEIYWIGWLVRRWEKRYGTVEKEYTEKSSSLLFPGWCLGGIFLCFTLIFWGGVTLTSVSALISLRRGEAQQYYNEYQKRLEILQDDTAQEVYLEPFTYKPYLLFFNDVATDANDWVNKAVARYYGKTAVYLVE